LFKEETGDVESKSSQLKRQQSYILEVEKVLERNNQTLERLREKRDSFVFAMMEQDYEKANEVVDAVMGDICQSLASHIHRRHSEMIEQYLVLDSKT
jgi:nucleotidyltransferase/DNA polymerase involved in DNA repair